MVPSALPLAPLATLLQTAARQGVHPTRLHILAVLMVRYALLEPLRLIERNLFDRHWSELPMNEDPLFVLGHWRSGTSYLQTLLALDARATTSTLYRSIFSDVSAVSESWLKPGLDAIARLLRLSFSLQRQPLQLDLPAECDIGLCAQLSSCSYSFGHLFPKHFNTWLHDWVLNLDEARTDAWLADLDRFIRKLSFAAGGRRVVVKSPGDTARLARLASYYPQSRFVYVHRDPIEVYHSSHYFWRVIRREYSLHRISDADIDRLIMTTYPCLIDSYLKQRRSVANSRLVEVSFERLRDHPIATLRQVYGRLDLGPLDEQRLVFELGLSRQQARPEHDRSPKLEQRLRRAWSSGFELWQELQ